MPIPTFQEFLLPTLQFAADGKEHSVAELRDTLGDHFALTDSDRTEMLPSGTQTRLQNRVYWARTYLAKAGLFEVIGRGRIRITAAGLDLLRANPGAISRELLLRYEGFRRFAQGDANAASPAQPEVVTPAVDEQTPEEQLEASYGAIKRELADRLLQQVKKSSPAFFERLVVDLLVAMGYGGSRVDAGRAVGQRGDGGVDGIIKEDHLGLDVVYLQAKRWENPVGSPAVRDFVGSLVGHSASKGVMITTSRYSRDAEEYVRRLPQKVVLIDGERLADMMIDFSVGVTTSSTYVIKRLDLDYFDES